MNLYRELNEKEKQDFRDWARVHYKPYSEIKGIWHVVVQEECVKINREADQVDCEDCRKCGKTICGNDFSGQNRCFEPKR